MALITVREFAEKHKVTPRAIRYYIKDKKIKRRFGVVVVDSNMKYKPRKK